MMTKTRNKHRTDDSATDSPDDSDLDSRVPNQKFDRNSGPILKKIKIKGYDTTDALPKSLSFTILDILSVVYSICSFFFDVAFDVAVAMMHYYNGNTWWFTLTICFIAVPSLTMTGFSLRWYLVDADEKKLPPVSTKRWVLRIVFLVLQMGPLLRYIDSLYFGLKSNHSKPKVQEQVNFYKQMIYEDADATLLRLFECFMEAAPQLVLQLYIYTMSLEQSPDFYTWTEVVQLVSMFISLVSMSWALASYQRALRYSLEDKKNMTLCGTALQLIWRFFDIAARVLALGLFTSIFPKYMFIVCAVHYAIMFIWIRFMNTEFCDNKCGEFFYNLVLGVIFIFCYFNPKDSPTRRRFTFYYVLCFLENSALMGVWFYYCPAHVSYKYPAMFLQFLSFVFGLAVMMTYYLLVHPTKNISVWDHWVKTKASSVQLHTGDSRQTGPANEVQEQRL